MDPPVIVPLFEALAWCRLSSHAIRLASGSPLKKHLNMGGRSEKTMDERTWTCFQIATHNQPCMREPRSIRFHCSIANKRERLWGIPMGNSYKLQRRMNSTIFKFNLFRTVARHPIIHWILPSLIHIKFRTLLLKVSLWIQNCNPPYLSFQELARID